jgi:hypothetical protein
MSRCANYFRNFQNGRRCHGNGQNAKKIKNTKMIIAGLLAEERKKERKKERRKERKKNNNKNNNKKRSKHNMSPKLRLGDITSMLSTLHPCLITGPTFL